MMPVKSSAVGLTSKPYECEITDRRLLAYAAGIGDINPCYLDDAATEGIVGHPAFCVALEWPVALALRDDPKFQILPEERLRAVHAQQDSIFHRPIRPGDRLQTTGTLALIRRIKPGAFVVTKYETIDAITGAPVVTSYSSGIFRGVSVDGADTEIEAMPVLPTPSNGADMSEHVSIPIHREAPHVYTECAQIWNPIHTERTVALAAGLPDIILHGTATWAIAMSQLVNLCAGGDPTRLKRFSGRFAAMVIPGTTVTLKYGRPKSTTGTVPYIVCNAEGAPAISQGVAVVDPSV